MDNYTSKSSRYGPKFSQLNLYGKGLDLERHFDSIINKIPDLCMPAAVNLAGEDDYFDRTKDLKLIPFRKQDVFERCISPPSMDLCIRHGSPSLGGHKSNSEWWPFADPMPSCMSIPQNIDNLRQIIVSSLDIEWKMLTPIRPETEYEESYFDKLINLHRSRYRLRLQKGLLASEGQTNSVFKHTRHGLTLQGPELSSSTSRDLHSQPHQSVSFGAKLKRRFRAKAERSRSIVGHPDGHKLNIPTLTLTQEDPTSSAETIVSTKLFEDSPPTREDDLDYTDTYENFSRLSVTSLSR